MNFFSFFGEGRVAKFPMLNDSPVSNIWEICIHKTKLCKFALQGLRVKLETDMPPATEGTAVVYKAAI
jgi:hypothetical protein